MQTDRRQFLTAAAAATLTAITLPALLKNTHSETSPATVFAEVRDYWETNGYEYVKGLKNNQTPTPKDAADIAKRMLDLCNDATIDGKPFKPKGKTIDGNSSECLRGTILDVHAPSDIQPYQKKVAIIAKNLAAHADGRPQYVHLCEANCVGCEKLNPSECVTQLKATFSAVFDLGGIFDSCEAKATTGKWKQ